MNAIGLLLFATAIAGILAGPLPASEAPAMRTASFADLARRADAGEPLTAVFFGCSLTWGANSTDPQRRSYRAVVGERLARRWPRARWTCVDAAIGGTDSRLGAFRFDRDVAAHHPDLVFIDFTLNDGIAADPDHLASYEAIVRRTVAGLGAPAVQVLLPGKEHVRCLDLERFRTRAAHLAIADAYGTGVGDAFTLMQERFRAGRLDLDQAWDNPADITHPGDLGYALYAEAAWQGLESALADGRSCRAPERPLHADTYLRCARVRLAGLAPLPSGWTAGRPTRISAWYDSLMSRWLDDEVVASPGAAALELRFRGATALLFGEATIASGAVRVLIDGQPARQAGPDGLLDCSARRFGGTVKLNATLATGLDPAVEHTLRLEPQLTGEARELRIESLCVAGGAAPAAWR